MKNGRPERKDPWPPSHSWQVIEPSCRVPVQSSGAAPVPELSPLPPWSSWQKAKDGVAPLFYRGGSLCNHSSYPHWQDSWQGTFMLRSLFNSQQSSECYPHFSVEVHGHHMAWWRPKCKAIGGEALETRSPHSRFKALFTTLCLFPLLRPKGPQSII